MTPAVAKLVFLLVAIASFFVRYPHWRRSRKLPVRVSVRDLDETIVGAIAVIGLAIVPLLYVASGFPRFADYRFEPAFGWIGALAMVAALYLFYRAHRDLSCNFSASLDIRLHHTLVTTGVYARVRHPMYTAFWVWGAGQALLLPNWVAGPAGLVGFAVLFFRRVGREEQLMVETFGQDYRAYMARTARLFPGIY
jgi:protein-S-isoprenylcysteine O-methyltransferase Ste14